MRQRPTQEELMATPDERPTMNERLNDGARRIDEKAQALGREAQVAADRLATNPAIRDVADTAGRIWGLVLLVAGLWLFAAITLGLSLPGVAWSDFWPVILILFGGLILFRGLARRG